MPRPQPRYPAYRPSIVGRMGRPAAVLRFRIRPDAAHGIFGAVSRDVSKGSPGPHHVETRDANETDFGWPDGKVTIGHWHKGVTN